MNGDAGAGLGRADALIIVPPFWPIVYPSLAAHLLQATAAARGKTVRVVYANLLFAAAIGEAAYLEIADSPMGSFLGERFFARAAYGTPPLGRNSDRLVDFTFGGSDETDTAQSAARFATRMNVAEMLALEARAGPWIDDLADQIASWRYPIVGATTTFEQTSASIALLDAIKRRSPGTRTIIGGANCEGPMADGIAGLPSSVDWIFSGESDATFAAFIESFADGEHPPTRIVHGQPCLEMDTLPCPRFDEYLMQREDFLPADTRRRQRPVLTYETSRGCWWGQKHHCVFCGLNGEGMVFRQKSAATVVQDLRAITSATGISDLLMVDNIMPAGYFDTLLPALAAELPGLNIFYEQKSNLTVERVMALERAGVRSIQPGIEALSTSLLRRMRKGVTGSQNLMLLRYCRAAAMDVRWNLLSAFPGDDGEDYRETLALVRLIHHLPPPTGVSRIRLDRFSPYYEKHAEFGIRDVRPFAGYRDFLPEQSDIARIAYHFTGEYETAVDEEPELLAELRAEVADWAASWGNVPPELRIGAYRDAYLLADTRGLDGTNELLVLSHAEAAGLLTSRRWSDSEFDRWATKGKLAVCLDGRFVPLAVAPLDLLRQFETEGVPPELATTVVLQR